MKLSNVEGLRRTVRQIVRLRKEGMLFREVDEALGLDTKGLKSYEIMRSIKVKRWCDENGVDRFEAMGARS